MIEEKVNNLLKEAKIFNMHVSGISYDDNEEEIVYAEAYQNCLIIEPLTAQAEREIKFNPYARTLSSSKHFYCLQYFPNNIPEEVEKLPPKYRTRLDNLVKAREQGKIELYDSIVLPVKEFLRLKYTAKPYEKRKDYDYKDDMEDTSCKQLAKPPKTFATIERVSLTYNTVLILHNAKENKNKALSYYKDTQTFYNDCIINYILEHANILTPENFRYPNPIQEVHISGRELLKLYPHRTFKIEVPSGIEIKYSRESARLSKKDTVIFKFNDDYLKQYKDIIKRADNNIEAPNSFIRIPIFFVLEALKNENLGSRSLNFLLWFLCFYRMPNPYLLHSVKKIIDETGMDIKHGYKKPVRRIQKYLDYLYIVNALKIEEPAKPDKINLDSPIKYNGALIRIQKPKKQKEKN